MIPASTPFFRCRLCAGAIWCTSESAITHLPLHCRHSFTAHAPCVICALRCVLGCSPPMHAPMHAASPNSSNLLGSDYYGPVAPVGPVLHLVLSSRRAGYVLFPQSPFLKPYLR